MKKVAVLAAIVIAMTAQNLSAQSLTTNPPTTGLSNNNAGIFFDLTPVASSPGLLVNQIDTSIWVTTGQHNVQIWTKPGSYVGFDTDPSAWTQHSTFTVSAVNPATTPINFVLPTPIQLDAGQTTGVYLLMETGGIRYTGGTNPQTTFSNADLTLFSERGRSGGAFGGSVFTPRAFAGTIHYSAIPEPGSLGLLAVAGLVLLPRRRKR